MVERCIFKYFQCCKKKTFSVILTEESILIAGNCRTRRNETARSVPQSRAVIAHHVLAIALVLRFLWGEALSMPFLKLRGSGYN